MGLFGRLFSRSPSTFNQVRQAYQLEKKKATHPMIRGSAFPKVWWGHAGGVPFTIRRLGHWEVILGKLFPVIDLELSRPGSGARDLRNIPLDGHEPLVTYPEPPLADKFFISMIGHQQKDFLGPQLRDPEVSAGLVQMSPVVEAVALYRQGVELRLNGKRVERESFDGDLNAAVRVAQRLEQLHTDATSLKYSLPCYDPMGVDAAR